MTRLAKAAVLTLSILVCAYVALGHLLGQTAEDRAYRSLTVYSEVLHYIQQDYVDEPHIPLVTSGALHGLLESLDPRSSYLTPREYAEYKKWFDSTGARKPGTSHGEIGVALSKRFGYIVVVAALPDSPAQHAGLRTGDILEAIAGFTTRELSIGQAQSLLAGEPASPVKLSVVRRGRIEPQEMDVPRGQLAPSKLMADVLPEPGAPAETAVAYIRVPKLDAGRSEEIRNKLVEFDRKGIHRLVLDLRDCAFGEILEAVATARLFLNSGNVATLRGQTVPRQEYAAEPAKVAWKHPAKVLISDGTSGAAEVLAAALADNNRAETVGERTWGSASEQKIIPLDDGAALVLTVANYYTPGGKSIPTDGIVPRVDVSDADTPGYDESTSPSVQDDRPLKRAIELLLAPPGAPADKSAAKKSAVHRNPAHVWSSAS